jgi:hypothetical protein
LALARESDGPATIRIHGGTYEDVSVELGPEDSGLTIEAAPGESPVLSGGIRLTDWRDDGDGLVACDLPAVDGEWDFRSLIVDGAFADRARLPETGTLTHESRFDSHWMSSTAGGWDRKPTEEELTTLQYREGDLGAWLVPENAEVQVFHQWDDSLVGVSAIDPAKRRLTFSSPCGHPPGAFAQHGNNPKAITYIVWNLREGIHRPGQWYLDRARNKVVYRPLPGQNMEKTAVIAPRRHSVIRIHAPLGEPVQGITLRGLTLTATSTPLIQAGFGAHLLPGAVEVSGDVSGLVLEDLHIHHPGGTGIRIGGIAKTDSTPASKPPRDIAIRRSTVTDCGACGMSLQGRHLTIEDNRLERLGCIYPATIALRTGGSLISIRHNEVSDCPYSAIVAGGTGNRVEFNRITRFMQVLDDGAAIYSFAFKNGIYRGNVVVGTSHREASAYYFDEQSEGSVIEENLAVDTAWPNHNHMAQACHVRDNIFLDSGNCLITLMRSTDFIFARNVVCAEGDIIIRGPEDALTGMPDNLFHSRSGSLIRRIDDSEGYATAREEPLSLTDGSRTGDPLYANVKEEDFSTPPESPVHGLGLLAQDFSTAGVRTGETG